MHSDDGNEATRDDRVHLTVPASTEYLQLLRLCTAGLAGDVFGVDDVEDLKIAMEELAAVLVSAAGTGDAAAAVEFVFERKGDRFVVAGRRGITGLEPPTIDDFLTTILDAVVDSHAIEADETGLSVRFEKRVRGE